MQLTLASDTPHHVIHSYATGMVRINAQEFRSSVVVMPDRLLPDWPAERFEDLLASHFEMLLTLEPEIVLLGTGAKLRFPAPAITATLINVGIGVEVMDTAAACRTYNVLVAEERRVAAALLMI